MRRFFLGLAAALALHAPPAQAQSTDAYHAIQVLPVVVDSTSFVDRMTFRNPNGVGLEIEPTFRAAIDTNQVSPATCPKLTLPPRATVTVVGLRQLCPGLASGSLYGHIHFMNRTFSTDARQTLPFSVYSRVDTPAGIGFSVEAFPAHTFTSAESVVTGLRRRAATANSPAYQTNCFISTLHPVEFAGPFVAEVAYEISNADGVVLGTGGVSGLTSGRMVRFLDIFSTPGVPAGDHDDAQIRFTLLGTPTSQVGLISFCTVQENTNFSADFRIGKQERGRSSAGGAPSVAAQDDQVLRETQVGSDVSLPEPGFLWSTRAFTIPANGASNAHLLHFRHPDLVACELIDPSHGQRALQAYGLEMRLISADDRRVVAGGDNVQGFSMYLGDKWSLGGGASTRYLLEVEGSGTNPGVVRPYQVHCRSGSGHGLAELVRINGPILF